MEMLHCLKSLRTLVWIVKVYIQSFINQDGKHSAGFQCNQMHQVALTVHDINTHSFYESLSERKIKHYYTFNVKQHQLRRKGRRSYLLGLPKNGKHVVSGAVRFLMTTTSPNTSPTLPSLRLAWPSRRLAWSSRRLA